MQTQPVELDKARASRNTAGKTRTRLRIAEVKADFAPPRPVRVRRVPLVVALRPRRRLADEVYQPLSAALVAGLPSPSIHPLVAAALDRSSRASVPLGSIWGALVGGTCFIEYAFQTEHRCILVLREATRTEQRPRGELETRNVDILQRVLLSDCRKRLADDLGVSQPLITQAAAASLEAMGLPLPASRAPIVLVMAAHQYCSRELADPARSSSARLGSTCYRIVSIPTPEKALAHVLSRAECDVVHGLVQGKRYDEIATLRGTSPRTIANQINAIFRKLGISGRGELLHQLSAPPVRMRWALPA